MGRPDLRLGIACSGFETRFYCRHFVPCPACGGMDHEDLGGSSYNIDRGSGDLHDARLRNLKCRACARAHSVEFLFDRKAEICRDTYVDALVATDKPPYSAAVLRQMLHNGPPGEPSRVILPHQFARLVVEATTTIPEDRGGMPFATFDPYRTNLYETITTLNELEKFFPEGATTIDAKYTQSPEARNALAKHPEWFTRSWFDEQMTRWTALQEEVVVQTHFRHTLPSDDPRSSQHRADERPPIIHPFHSAMLRQHEKWLADKERKAGQQLVARKVDASGYKVDFRDLSNAILEDVTLDQADMESVQLHGSTLTRVSMRETGLAHAKLAGTELIDCTFDSADLAFANLGDAVITSCDFTDAHLERSTWYRSQVTHGTFVDAKLNNAAFNDARFVDCDFRGADFSLAEDRILGTGWNAVFERCDLRDTNWAGVDLYRAKFIDCQFAGATGAPTLADVVIEGGDTRDVAALAAQLGAVEPLSAEPDRSSILRRARETLDALIDSGASFDETVAALVALGLTREEALDAVIDPGRLARR